VSQGALKNGQRCHAQGTIIDYMFASYRVNKSGRIAR
jgi:hypothetical protein